MKRKGSCACGNTHLSRRGRSARDNLKSTTACGRDLLFLCRIRRETSPLAFHGGIRSNNKAEDVMQCQKPISKLTEDITATMLSDSMQAKEDSAHSRMRIVAAIRASSCCAIFHFQRNLPLLAQL